MQTILNTVGILSVAFGIAASAYSLGRSHGWMAAIADEAAQAEARARVVEQVRAMGNRELLDFGVGKTAGERK